jgi:hypothetical protein
MLDVSLLIVNYRTPRLLRQSLKAIGAAPPRHVHEIIVVDNHSGDGALAAIREEFPQVQFLETDRNGGTGYGNNFALQHGTGRYLFVLNADIILKPGAVDALCAFLDAHPDIGAAGPRLLRFDGTFDDTCYRFPSLLMPLYRRTLLGRLPAGRKQVAHYLMTDFDYERTGDVDWLLGAAIMVRREVYEQIGGFDRRFFMYFEDTDWCRRIWEAGWRVTFFPGAEAIHFHTRESARYPWFVAPLVSRTARAHLASWIKYFRKYNFVEAPPIRRRD